LSHSARVTSLSFAPDGKRLACVTHGAHLHLWDLADPKSPGHTDLGAVDADRVRFGPDGSVMVFTLKYEVQRWDPVSRTRIGTPFRAETGNSLDVAPDGRSLAIAATSGLVTQWNPFTGDRTADLRLAGSASTVRYDPSGSRLLTVETGGRLRSWRRPRVGSRLDRHVAPLRLVFNWYDHPLHSARDPNRARLVTVPARCELSSLAAHSQRRLRHVAALFVDVHADRATRIARHDHAEHDRRRGRERRARPVANRKRSHRSRRRLPVPARSKHVLQDLLRLGPAELAVRQQAVDATRGFIHGRGAPGWR
jgi:WD40 repeat protein